MKKLAFGIVALATVALFSCKGSGGGDPKSALKGFFEAMSKKDIAAAKKFATEESSSMFSMMELGLKEGEKKEGGDMMKDFDMSKVEFGEAIIDGDKAKVPVKNKAEGETINFRLKKEKGDWKVAFDKASMMEMATEKMAEPGFKDSLNNAMDKIGDMDSISGEMNEAMKEAGPAMEKAAEEVKKSLKEIETEKK
jgi:hypothetical protein